ncbi:hypothetical protein EJ07DRAFT_159593 [Lizonia empirigonia]|nr:hypothetical protein EJ07DRAFT_159593 [Lizonia empirigonia]
MPSFFNTMSGRSESRPHMEQTGQRSAETKREGGEDLTTKSSKHPKMVEKRRSDQTHATSRPKKPVRSSGRSSGNETQARHRTKHHQSAALSGLYGKRASARKSTERRRTGDDEDDDPNDPIIKCSMYPQMVGKRMSELTRALNRSEECGHASSEARGRAATDRSMYQSTRRMVSEYRPNLGYLGSDLSADSGYESDGPIMEGRPVRARMYPQQDPRPSFNKTMSTASSRRPLDVGYMPHGLPHDEYMSLVRRQTMERTRQVLEAHFAHHSNRQGPRVWHGLMQPYQIRNSERRRISKVMYAVRKALKADFDLLSDEYELARHRHAAKTPFCELSDVDGVPLPYRLVVDFTRALQEAQDNAYVPKLTGLPYGEPIQRTWIDERIRKAAALRRVDSGIVMDQPAKRPQLVSKFSWDSDNEGDMRKRKRLTKVKRSRGSGDYDKENVIVIGQVKVRSPTIHRAPSTTSLRAVFETSDDECTSGSAVIN